MKRFAFTILIIAVVSIPAQAKYSGGSGEPNDPYKIANVSDLLTLAADTNDYNKCFIMTADIDLDPNLPGGQVFTTAVIARDVINSNAYFDGIPFSGVFDGAGHKIINLTINTGGAVNDYLGLFGDINEGELKNITLENIYVVGKLSLWAKSEYIGGLLGYNDGNVSNCYSAGTLSFGETIGGLVGYNEGTISDCFSTNIVSDGTGLGGLVGNNNGTISNCYSEDTVSRGRILGGLVGYNKGTISNCYSSGAIYGGDHSQYLGGLVGWNRQGNINDCYSIGDVTGGYRSDIIGGLVGENDSSISGSYARGDVRSGDDSRFIGGLVGANNAGRISDCYSTGTVFGSSTLGGLVGRNDEGYITKCYSTGDVFGSSTIGWLLGLNNGGSIDNCYFLARIGPSNGYGILLTDTQMKQQSSFVGWDFVNIWFVNEGVGYPYLKRAGLIPGYPGGSGTPEDPYQISTKEDLLFLGANPADYCKCFILTADVNLASRLSRALIAADTHTGFGFQGIAFTGTFDGNGHKIIHFSILGLGGVDYLGLFGLIGSGGSVKNLGIENFSVYGELYIGGLVGYNNGGNISKCFTRGAVFGQEYVGGLVGFDAGSISNCYSTGLVNGASWYAGGLVGYKLGGALSNCYSTSTVSGLVQPGGLVGYNEGSISNSYFLIPSGPNNGCGEPLTDEQMKQQASFVGWDFITPVWTIIEGVDYPHLWWENTPPIANAGPDQTVYAWIDGIAEVNLDGSGSYDEDGDELTYSWSWTIDGNTYDTNGVNPTIELPVGRHTISLIVNDGLIDSEPNEVNITVIGPVEANLCVVPKVLNCRSHLSRIMAMLRLPRGITRGQIDTNEPILLYPGEIEADWMRIGCGFDHRCRAWNTTIFALFDKDEFMDAVDENGRVEVTVVGRLKTGQYFFGTDDIRIICPGRRPRHCP